MPEVKEKDVNEISEEESREEEPVAAEAAMEEAPAEEVETARPDVPEDDGYGEEAFEGTVPPSQAERSNIVIVASGTIEDYKMKGHKLNLKDLNLKAKSYEGLDHLIALGSDIVITIEHLYTAPQEPGKERARSDGQLELPTEPKDEADETTEEQSGDEEAVDQEAMPEPCQEDPGEADRFTDPDDEEPPADAE